jgi:hypothetical protein
MNDYQLVVSVGELMLKEKVITEFGLKMLNNDIESDMETLRADQPEKITRTAIYFTIVFNMAILYAGYCAEYGADPRSEKLKQIAEIVSVYIPKLLRGLDNTYLEVFHGAKIKAFEHGRLFDDYFPNHPEEQKLFDSVRP